MKLVRCQTEYIWAPVFKDTNETDTALPSREKSICFCVRAPACLTHSKKLFGRVKQVLWAAGGQRLQPTLRQHLTPSQHCAQYTSRTVWLGLYTTVCIYIFNVYFIVSLKETIITFSVGYASCISCSAKCFVTWTVTSSNKMQSVNTAAQNRCSVFALHHVPLQSPIQMKVKYK